MIHTFFHDVQVSISLQTKNLMSYMEMCFSLPASRDLWKAPTAHAWREIYIRKRPLAHDTQIPRVADIMHCVGILDDFEENIDMELCYIIMLYGYWGQIAAYQESLKFYSNRFASNRNQSHLLWLKSQHQELYRDLCDFSIAVHVSRKGSAQLSMIIELFMMMLHVSSADLQTFAGKHGEEEARRAAYTLEQTWARTSEARYAVWHAGQVFLHARRQPPTCLRGFNAMAVYLASLTMWVYGLLSGQQQQPGYGAQGETVDANSNRIPAPGLVLLDGEETRETRAFLQLERGVPGLTLRGDPGAGGVEALATNPGAVLGIARGVFRENFPIRSEPLPPLVESLENLLRDLGSGPAGRLSRNTSEAPS